MEIINFNKIRIKGLICFNVADKGKYICLNLQRTYVDKEYCPVIESHFFNHLL